MDNKIIFKTTTKTGKTLTFRYPTIDDLQIITDFINKVSQEKTFIRFQGEILKLEDEEKWLKDVLLKIKNKQKVYLMAFVGDKFIGSSDIELYSLSRKHVGTFGIVLDKDFRGDGIGKILMNLTIEESKKNLKGLKTIVLECFADNIIGQSLYKKMGFKKYGLLPEASFRQGKFVDEILMYKKI